MTPSLKLVTRYRRLLEGDGRFSRRPTSFRHDPRDVRAAIGESRRSAGDGAAKAPAPASR